MALPLVVFDFDGVLHEHAVWRGYFGQVDNAAVRAVQLEGFAVAVMTANSVGAVARELRRAGVDAKPDRMLRRNRWSHPTKVLVTQRKLCGGVAFVDDRAVPWTYGSGLGTLIAQVCALRDIYREMHSKRSVP